jgi:S-adenosylmethionine hydrolase
MVHEIPPGDILAGAFALMSGYSYFPKGTIHVAVVDPGVGTARPALAVTTRHYCFVGPDNGVLSLALAREQITDIRRIENAKLFHQPLSRTFHGRDIFAPVAAHISRGLSKSKLGPAVSTFEKISWPKTTVVDGIITGSIVYLDRFGNAITSIANADLAAVDLSQAKVQIGRHRAIPVRQTYQDVAVGRPVALAGSSGWLELAVNGGNAVQQLGLRCGQTVHVVR